MKKQTKPFLHSGTGNRIGLELEEERKRKLMEVLRWKFHLDWWENFNVHK